MSFRRIFIILACVLLTQSFLVSCGKKDGDGQKNDAVAESNDSAKTDNDSAKVKDGKWPEAIYSKYDIDEIDTKGKLVFTDFPNDGPYRYQVYYHGVTREELNAWVDKLIAKGFRIHDRDKERLSNSKNDYDTMIYLKGEKQPYRLRIAFDFNSDMDFEYYADPESHNPAFTVTEKEEHGETHYYIYYNLSISLNPLKTDVKMDGSFDSLGLKAEDLKVNDSVRDISMSENANGGVMDIRFYSDHFTTKEEFEACRDLITDKLAEKGATFKHLMSGKEMTAAELKESGIGGYMIENNGKKFMMMVDPDSEFNEFGGRYGVRLMIKK